MCLLHFRQNVYCWAAGKAQIYNGEQQFSVCSDWNQGRVCCVRSVTQEAWVEVGTKKWVPVPESQTMDLCKTTSHQNIGTVFFFFFFNTVFKGYTSFTVILGFWLYSPCCTIHLEDCWILVPCLRIELGPCAVQMWSPDYLTARELSDSVYFSELSINFFIALSVIS